MPNFEICYVKDDGSLAGKIAANCDTEMQAKVLAHAMRLDSTRRIEVWQDNELVYRRPGDPVQAAARHIAPAA